MTLDQLKTDLKQFRQKVQDFRGLLHISRSDALPVIVRNQQQITQKRSELNAEYGRLENFIQKFGKDPWMSVPVNPQPYRVYNNAFSSDILQRVSPSINAVLQDLDYIIGKLNAMTEKEFRKALEPSKPKKDYWHFTNPFWLSWRTVKLMWRHRVVSSVAIALLGLLAIDYSLAWQNAIRVWKFITGFFK